MFLGILLKSYKQCEYEKKTPLLLMLYIYMLALTNVYIIILHLKNDYILTLLHKIIQY